MNLDTRPVNPRGIPYQEQFSRKQEGHIEDALALYAKHKCGRCEYPVIDKWNACPICGARLVFPEPKPLDLSSLNGLFVKKAEQSGESE